MIKYDKPYYLRLFEYGKENIAQAKKKNKTNKETQETRKGRDKARPILRLESNHKNR